MTLLELQYGGRVQRSQIAQEQAKETGTSVRESKSRMDVGLFLDEYPRWELGTPYWSVILHEMFLHAAERGQKEAECMVCWGHWGSASKPNPEAGHSTIELVGYCISHKEIQDIYQSVYLLWRPLGLPSCGDELRRRMIQDIISSLKDCLYRCRYPATTGEDPGPQEEWQSRLNRWNHTRKLLGWPTKGHWILLMHFKVILKGWVREWGIGHQLTLELTPKSTAEAAVEVTLGVGAGVAAGLVARVILGAALRVDNQGPLTDLHLGGGWPLGNLRWSQTPKEV